MNEPAHEALASAATSRRAPGASAARRAASASVARSVSAGTPELSISKLHRARELGFDPGAAPRARGRPARAAAELQLGRAVHHDQAVEAEVAAALDQQRPIGDQDGPGLARGAAAQSASAARTRGCTMRLSRPGRLGP